MNKEWSLDVMYKGYDDPKFKADYAQLEELAQNAKQEMAKASELSDVEGLEKAIGILEQVNVLTRNLGEYASLRSSTDTSDGETNSMVNKIDRLASEFKVVEVMFGKYVSSIKDLDAVIENSELLKDYAYLLKKTKEDASHMLSDDLEDMIAKMNLTGGAAWGRLFDFLTSSLKVDYKGSTVTLPEIRNLANSSDQEERKSAYEAELAAYEKIADSIAFSLNNIKAQVKMLSQKRGFASPLDMTLDQCCMKRETLEAMLTAMREYLPKFWEYLKAKAHYLGHEGSLPWYDMFAPVGTITTSYTAETAKKALTESFLAFTPEMSEMMERAFDESWIDFYPHSGKVGGAFCAGLESTNQSRILTNFNGSFDAVVTLAHELGHAFHNQQVYGNRTLNRDYSMPVAETASTFNETHFMLSAYESTEDKGEKLAILENLLSGTTQIICDIYSRFLFEDAVFEKCTDEFLMTKDLKEIMLAAQKQAYGDGLDENFLHPYMWTCKSHYYSSGLSYYNFPYAFGGLFAMGLYTKYKEEGSAFVLKYKSLLKATATSSVEDTAKMADIDLTKPDFWRSSLATFAKLIDEYAELAKN